MNPLPVWGEIALGVMALGAVVMCWLSGRFRTTNERGEDE